MTEVLDLHAVTKRYGSHTALADVGFTLRAGEFAALLGPNGAGKSTLLQILAGLFAPDSGKVSLFGLTHRRDGSAILRRLGVVFQSRSVDLDMTVRANLRFHGRLFGLSGRALDARIRDLADQFGLVPMLDRPVRQMSGGQQRRVEIARALIAAPRLLIMDEPTAGLDIAGRRDLVAHVRTLARDTGVAVLWATHLVDEVEQADRIILLRGGQVIADATPAALLARTGAPSLASAYVALTGEAPAPA
jgi:ABC-2 type transport system ATP-binding protein